MSSIYKMPSASLEHANYTNPMLYIEPGADPALQISKSTQIEEMNTMDSETLRNVCVLHSSVARFQIRKICFGPFIHFNRIRRKDAIDPGVHRTILFKAN